MSESKSGGVTESEAYLKDLCDKLFLSLWSYPNVYRDQRDTCKGQGKELCDLLVVFRNDVIIFSDKRCAFKRTGNIETDWERWYKKTVFESARQAWGAERWLKDYPGRLFLDRNCTIPFPIELPKPLEMNVHIVVVSHEVSKVCREEIGGSGSLTLSSTPLEGMNSETFLISDLDKKKKFVHVLDDVTLDVLLNNLTTVDDFVSYLNKKEKLFRSGKYIRVDGEENLLGIYLENINEDGDHDFPSLNGYKAFHVPDEIWIKYQCRPERLAQIDADEISYAWDHIIEKFTGHLVAKTFHHSTHEDEYTFEKALRFLASENRTLRRVLSTQLLEVWKHPNPTGLFKRFMLSPLQERPAYLFLSLVKKKDMPDEEYRLLRRKSLHANCMALKLRYPDVTHIVGIAVGSKAVEGSSSEDLEYIDAREWNEELQQEALELMKIHEIDIKLPDKRYIEVREYPEIIG